MNLVLTEQPEPEHLGCPDCESDCLRRCGDGWFLCLICGISF